MRNVQSPYREDLLKLMVYQCCLGLKTQMLTVTYDPAKTNKDELSKKLAAVGHDTRKV